VADRARLQTEDVADRPGHARQVDSARRPTRDGHGRNQGAAKTSAVAASARQLRVGFVLTHDFTLTAFSAFLDVLRLAADDGDTSRPISCTWQVMNTDRRLVRASCGIEVQPSADWLAPSSFDFVVVVGGLLRSHSSTNPDLNRYLTRAARAGTPLVGVCTGSFLLCRLGLMERRKCCVSWYHYKDFVEQFPESVPIADRLFVIDGDRITCSGGAGVADLAAHLVTNFLGAARARKALNILLISRPRSGDDVQPAPPITAGGQGRIVSRALLMMEQNLAPPRTIGEIGSALNLGARQLERLFQSEIGKTPQKTYMEIRLRHARWMLDNTSLRVSQIAAELGFADGAHLSRRFKLYFGELPTGRRRLRQSTSLLNGDSMNRRPYD
jgi:transcriptional regulator GlxA family with amidase domain